MQMIKILMSTRQGQAQNVQKRCAAGMLLNHECSHRKVIKKKSMTWIEDFVTRDVSEIEAVAVWIVFGQ